MCCRDWIVGTTARYRAFRSHKTEALHRYSGSRYSEVVNLYNNEFIANPGSRPTTTRRAIEAMKKSHTLPRKVGDFTTKLDRALPGKHTKKLYDSLKKTEAKILIQLRTAMGRINKYLHRIGAAELPDCACGVEKEDVKHFLFRCIRWTSERAPLRQYFTARESALS